MACARCGGTNSLQGQPCPVCHAASELRCGHCGFIHPQGARFCAGCARPVNVPVVMAESALAYLQSHVPADMIERMMRSANTMLGERKHVTVMFADVSGSTSMIEGLDPERALEIIAPAMRIMMDAVHQNEGIVNQTRGDGIMALFGAPLAHEDHAVRACSAALAMHEGVRLLARKRPIPIAIRVGLNSGQVVIHSIGSDLAMHYEASGTTTHLAARMEQLATPGAILMSVATHNLAQGFIVAEPRGAALVRGISEPVKTYELTGMSQHTRWQVRSARGLSRMVGRERELGALNEAIASAAAGKGQAILVVGAPGLGKSRLVHEVVRFLPFDWQVLEATCAPQRMHSSLDPVSSIVRALLQIGTGEDSAHDAVKGIKDALIRLDPTLLSLAPAILSLLDVDSADAAWKALDPSERRLRVVEAVKTLVARAAQRQRLLILVEDLHWADAETRLVIDNIARMLSDHRIVLLATQRPDGPETLEADWHLRLALSLFDDVEARHHIDQLMGEDIAVAQSTRHILEQAHGNPFFIEELVRAFRDRNAMEGLPRRLRLPGSDDPVALPETIHAVIAARIDYLDASYKSLLQACAVIGKEIPVGLLSKMVGIGIDELAPRLETLEAADFLFKTGPDPNADYDFRHELTREVAYGSLLLAVRRSLHAKAVEIIELSAGNRLDANFDRLADHAFRAERWDKAVPYLMRSGLRALKRSANRDAITILERGIEAASQLPMSDAKTQFEIDLRLALTIPLEPLGCHRRIYEVLNEAQKLTDPEKDPARAAAVGCQLSVAMFRLGEHRQALAVAEAAKIVADRIGDLPLIFAALHNIGIAYHELGQFARAVEVHQQCLSIEQPIIDIKRAGWAALPSVMLRTFLADSLIEMGRLKEAEVYAEDAARRANAANHAYSRITINQVRGRLQVRQGRAAEAVEMLRATRQLCHDLEIIQHYPILAARLGEAYLAAGQPQAAHDIIEAPEKLDVPLAENVFGWGQLLLVQGATLLALGRHTDAYALAEKAVRLAELRGESPQRAYAMKLLGDISLVLDKAGNTGARQFFQAALDIATSCGMQPLARQCSDAVARLDLPAYRLSGRAKDLIAFIPGRKK